jgi:hypothetical protein
MRELAHKRSRSGLTRRTSLGLSKQLLHGSYPEESAAPTLLRLRLLPAREGFSSCKWSLGALRGQQGLNTEVAEMLCALCVEA